MRAPRHRVLPSREEYLANPPKRKAECFWRQTIPEPNSGCLLWLGCIDHKGYGVYGKPLRLAHRVAWELTHGVIPRGEGHHGVCVLHRCDTPLCVNPDHLFLGTQADNARDMASKGRGNNAWRGRTHCIWGHEFTEENTLWCGVVGRQHRHCRACGRARSAKFYWQAKARRGAA